MIAHDQPQTEIDSAWSQPSGVIPWDDVITQKNANAHNLRSRIPISQRVSDFKVWSFGYTTFRFQIFSVSKSKNMWHNIAHLSLQIWYARNLLWVLYEHCDCVVLCLEELYTMLLAFFLVYSRYPQLCLGQIAAPSPPPGM